VEAKCRNGTTCDYPVFGLKWLVISFDEFITSCHDVDDMLTPCDDDDPLAAIATAPLLGEQDKSMMNLVLIKNNDSTVRLCLLYHPMFIIVVLA